MREGMVKNRTSLRSMLEQGIEAGLFVNNFNIDLSISVLYYTASAIVTRRELMLPTGCPSARLSCRSSAIFSAAFRPLRACS